MLKSQAKCKGQEK